MGVLSRVATYGRLVRFSHTIFALPFAVMGAVLGAEGVPTLKTGLFILMAMNRLADQAIDADNPRTRGRELPAGVVARGEVWGLLLVSLAVFVAACRLLNPLTLVLSPIVIVVLLSYPFAKRFTSLCHLWLGAALGLSPIGAYVAVRGEFGSDALAPSPIGAYVAVRGEFGSDALAPWLLGGAVVLWTAGFDVIYALLDVEFDRQRKLFSVPARLGATGALVVSALFHIITVGLLVAVGLVASLGMAWYVGVVLVAGIIFCEHWIVRPSDLSRVNMAFFTLNGFVSVLLMAAMLVDRLG